MTWPPTRPMAAAVPCWLAPFACILLWSQFTLHMAAREIIIKVKSDPVTAPYENLQWLPHWIPRICHNSHTGPPRPHVIRPQISFSSLPNGHSAPATLACPKVLKLPGKPLPAQPWGTPLLRKYKYKYWVYVCVCVSLSFVLFFFLEVSGRCFISFPVWYHSLILQWMSQFYFLLCLLIHIYCGFLSLIFYCIGVTLVNKII